MAAIKAARINLVVTTSRRPGEKDIRRARRYAGALHVPYWARADYSLPRLMLAASRSLARDVQGALVVAKDELSVWTDQGLLYYHPGMALHRVAALRRGGEDTMVNAMALQPGEAVLDCTAGLASDAVVASHAVGAEGRVVALESVGALALLLKVGLRDYPGQGPTLTGAMRRVRVRHTDYHHYLLTCAAQSFDVVYFDPMFVTPVDESVGMVPLRPVANHGQVDEETLQLAARVARRLVVVKARRGDGLHTDMRWDATCGSERRRVIYLLRYSGGKG